MRLYFAGADTEEYNSLLASQQVGSVLYSYHGLRKPLNNYLSIWKNKPNVFLDSGAFSAHFQGKTIDIDKYIKFIKNNKKYLTVYANLDVIGDLDKTQQNQSYIEEQGLQPLPVYHSPYEEVKVFEELANKYNYVGIGGIAGYKGKKELALRRIYKCLDIASKTNTKVHGFGITSKKLLNNLNFYSVDSTSWLAGMKFGTIYFFDGRKLKSYSKEAFFKKFQKFNNLHYKDLGAYSLSQWNAYSHYLDKKGDKYGIQKNTA